MSAPVRYVTFDRLPARRRQPSSGACGLCGSVVLERAFERHARWHARSGDLEVEGQYPPLTMRKPPTVMLVDGRSYRLQETA